MRKGMKCMNLEKTNKLKPKVLMVGPGRNVRGGITEVVNSYYQLGLDEQVDLKYITSMKDGSIIRKIFIAIKGYFQFYRCLNSCDIVHIHMAAQASFTRKSIFVKLAHKAGKKIIIHSHAADFDEFFFCQSNEAKQRQIQRIFSKADQVIVLSKEWAEFFSNNVCDSNKIIILHNGVILPEYVKKNYSDHNVLFLGRLGKRKGTYDLLKVIPDVLKKIPDVMFYFGGDGDIEQCSKIAVKEGFSEHIKFLGWVRGDEKNSYLDKCSIFVLPSYHEGMPMSVLEAMSYGLATISTNAGGIPQIIDNGVDGIRIDAGDINALAKNIESLLLNQEYKTKIAIRGSEKIKSVFNAKSNIIDLCKIYREII